MLREVRLAPYGAFEAAAVALGPGLTVVVGPNESGKSTLLAAVEDLLWGFEKSPRYAFAHARARLRVHARWDDGSGARELVRSSRGLLEGAGGEPVAPPWEQDGWDRAAWAQRLGMDHERLRAGGRLVLRGAGDLAALVFSAHHGSGAQELLESLDAEAERLWRPRGRSALKDRLAVIEALDAELGRTATRAGAVDAAREELAAARAGAERADARWRSARGAHEAAERRVRLAPRVRAALRERERAAELAAWLAGAGGALPEAAVAAHDAAVAAREGSVAALEALELRRRRLVAERGRCTVEEDVLAAGEELDALLDARQARAQDAEDAAAARRAAAEALREARGALAELAPVPDGPLEEVVPALLARLRVPADRAADLSARAAACARAEEELARAEEELAAARSAAERHASAAEVAEEDAAALRELVAAAEREGSAPRAWRAALAERDARAAAARAAAVEAGAADPDAALARQPALDAALVREHHAELLTAAAELERATGERERCAAAARAAAAALAQAAGGAGGAGEEELRAARAAREAALEPVRAGTALDATAAAALLAAVARADAAADALLEHAEAAAQLRQLRRDAERAATRESAALAAEEGARAAVEHARASRDALFTAAGVRVPEQDPAPVLAALEQLGAERAAAAAADARALRLRDDADAQLARLALVLERCGRPGAADAGLEPALEAARTVLAAAASAAAERALGAERERAAQEAAERCARRAEAAERAARAFTAAADAAGLPQGLGPQGWEARARTLAVAAERADAAGADLARAGVREERAAAFAAAVADVAARLGVAHGPGAAGTAGSAGAAGPGADPLAAALPVLAALAERLRTSRADERTAAALEQQLAEVADERAGELARGEAAGAQLAALLVAGEEPSALAERAGRSAALLAARAAERAELDALAAEVGAAGVEELLAEVGARTDADLRTDAEQLAVADDEAHAAWAEAQQGVGRAGTELERLSSGADANVLAARRAEALAELQADTERYVQVDLQRTVLRRQLEEFSTARANPLLEEAGQVLSVLTGGRWTALSALDDGGSRRLAVRRGDGEVLEGADGLSEGTADQVFLALRLAAIAAEHRGRVRAGAGPLPVVLDDVLMTFDEGRTGAALSALAQLSREVQVVLLTHHADVAERAERLAGEGHPVTVSRLPAPAAAQDLAAAARAAAAAPARPARGAGALGADPQLVRAWARAQGRRVADRGRVSEQLVLDYLAAHDLELDLGLG
ncbi:AAA family ATPase [Kineococcus gypseus]|uniref:AAA family ATPase n=1 Tax=Kineococcus gypseus TaxID=1637102 RepID=UPI003D7DD305